MTDEADHRPVFAVWLKPEKSVADPIKALRAALKCLRRPSVMRAISCEEVGKGTSSHDRRHDTQAG